MAGRLCRRSARLGKMLVIFVGDRHPRLLDSEEDLRDREEADDQRDEVHAAVEILEAEGEARLGGRGTHAHQSERR